MKKRTKRTLIFVVLLLLILVLCYCVHVYIINSQFSTMAKQGKERRIMLLYKTDHITLLNVCRKLIKEKREGGWSEERYDIRFKPHPEVSKLPQLILRLKPTWVFINNERVMIEMFGGLDHFGFHAFSEGFLEEDQKEYGDKKLLDGLWYYDDGYRKVANYDQYIESIKPK